MTLVDRPFLWIRSCAFCYRFSLFTRILPAVAFIPTCDGQAHGQTVYGSRHRQPHWRIPRGHDQTGLYRRFIGLSQIVTGIFLLIPRLAHLGAAVFLPSLVNIGGRTESSVQVSAGRNPIPQT